LNILVVGSGGREHALAWKCAQSPMAEKVYVAPGNPGIAAEKKCVNVDLNPHDFDLLADFAKTNDVGLTIVGPEAPLVEGIRDFFDAKGLSCFAPSRAASQLEGSKSFTKDFLVRHGIPTAAYKTFRKVDDAVAYVQSQGVPIVIKANGLAAGKGVVVAQSQKEANDAIRGMLIEDRFGIAGNEIVIEEFMAGEEASFIVLTDGRNIVPFATSQDHKARDEGDTGPNTGGLGAYSPAAVITEERYQRVLETIIEPTVQGMAADGHPYIGFLYAGLMITPDDEIKVVEFNCRFGDPEAQPIMMRMQDDLVDICLKALEGKLEGVELSFDGRVAVGVVMASGGYPADYETGFEIKGLAEKGLGTKIFHAGTSEENGKIVTSGGRVLCVVGLGSTASVAQQQTYDRIANIEWKGAYFRRDIGHRAIARENV
jgi:phosphoribosylamine--glycine ligase